MLSRLELVEELQNFQVKITEAANETFGALGEGYHDDVVMAIMIAAWAEHAPMEVLGCVRQKGDSSRSEIWRSIQSVFCSKSS